MKLLISSPICYLRVKNLWHDVTLLIFGVYKDGPNDMLEKLNSFTYTDFPMEQNKPRAKTLKAIPTVPSGNSLKLKYDSLLFSIDAWPEDIGTVEFELIPYQSVSNGADNVTFSVSRKFGDDSRIEYTENLIGV